MLDFYYWLTPNGWKVAIMLEECGLEYRVRPINIGRGDQFDDAFLKISPSNRMPVRDHSGSARRRARHGPGRGAAQSGRDGRRGQESTLRPDGQQRRRAGVA